MGKEKLLLVPFLSGLVLMFYSWYLSYPLSVISVDDSIFNHIPIFYWLSVPLLLISMFLMAITTKNNFLKWILTIGFVVVLYSLSYFYYMMATPDSSYFRGLTENFFRTHNLDASQFIHNYYQWPAFFLLADITTLVSGLNLATYEFLLYAIIGFLVASVLYIYATKVYNRSGFLAVAAFFIVMFLYFNYQAVPFSLAFALFSILLILDTREKKVGIKLTIIILYTFTVIAHAFVPLFFVIYLLLRSFIGKSREYFELFMLTLIIYLIVQITFAVFTFRGNIISAFTDRSEYSNVVGATFATTSIALDAIPHLISRIVPIAFGILCVVGFIFLILKRNLRKTDKAILLTGVVYSGLGLVLYTLGTRTIPLLFIPITLGLAYLFETKFRKYLKYLVVVLLIFVVFVSMHISFYSYPIQIQTKENFETANFMIEKYDWNSTSQIIAANDVKWYISTQVQGHTRIDADLEIVIANVINYDSIIYSVGLAHTLQDSNISIGETSQQIMDNFDLVYNSGYSNIDLKVG